MENTWKVLTERIANKTLAAPSWKSDQTTLLSIFAKAEKLGIDPTPLLGVSYSNLRTIIRPMKQAIWDNDIAKINILFEQCVTLSNSDLRLAMNVTEPEMIGVKVVNQDDEKVYVLSLTKGQFERLKTSTKLHFSFEV